MKSLVGLLGLDAGEVQPTFQVGLFTNFLRAQLVLGDLWWGLVLDTACTRNVVVEAELRLR